METLHTASFETPFGVMRAVSTEQGLAHLALPRSGGRGLGGWARRFAPGATLREGWEPNRAVVAQVLEYLDGKRERFELSLDLRGTAFQREVWDALLQVPYGGTRTYGEIARAIGRPGAVRSVGSANGANPVPLVVPCHRVVAAGGRLGGYGGGLEVKRALLALEQKSRPGEGRLL